MINLTLPYPPSVNNYYKRNRNGSVRIGAKGRDYRNQTIVIVNNTEHQEPLKGRIAVVLKAYTPDNRKRDLDNLFKCLFDSLQHAGIYENDSQVKVIHAYMMGKDKENSRVEITIEDI